MAGMTGEEAIKLLECAIIKYGTFTLHNENFVMLDVTELHVFDDKGEKKAVFI